MRISRKNSLGPSLNQCIKNLGYLDLHVLVSSVPEEEADTFEVTKVSKFLSCYNDKLFSCLNNKMQNFQKLLRMSKISIFLKSLKTTYMSFKWSFDLAQDFISIGSSGYLQLIHIF